MAGQMLTELKGLRFSAAHGLYAEEQKTGNEFEVDVTLQSETPEVAITSLEEAVNYAEVFRIVSETFGIRRDLLETIAMETAERLHTRFPQCKRISISIRKLTTPIAGFTGSAGITFIQDY